MTPCPPATSSAARRGRLARAAAWVLLALVSAPASAQAPVDLTQLSLDDLLKVEVASVSGASRYHQRVEQAPAAVTVFGHDEIVAYGCRTLADVLQMAAGFYTSYDRNYAYLGVRGFARPGDYNTRVLILVDGHRLNDNVYDQASVGTDFPIELDLVERVEIIRGPNSSLYGTSALLAAVNLVTRGGRDGSTPPVALTAGGGSLGTGTLGAQVASRWRGADLLFSASAYSSDGQKALYFPEYDNGEPGGGVAHDADGDRYARTFASIAFRGLRLKSAFGTRKKRIPTGVYETVFDDRRTWSVDTRAFVDLQYERSLRAGSVTARGFLDRYSYSGEYRYRDGSGESYSNRDETVGAWGGAEVFYTSPAGRRQRATLGGELVRHGRRDQINFDVESGISHLDDRRRSYDWAVYAQDHVRVTEQFALNGSLRFDRRGGLEPTFSPRLAAIADLSTRTTLKGLYGHVFRFPNAYEQYYHDRSFQKTNPDLAPESVHTWEVQLDQRFGRRARVAVGAFESRIEDLIDQAEDPEDGLAMFANLQSVQARGLEVEFEGRRREGPPLARAAYSLQWAKDSDSSLRLSNSPTHLARFGGLLPLSAWRSTLAGEVQYIGRRLTLAGQELSGAWLVHANLSRCDILPNVDVSLRVRNLLGTTYSDPVSVDHLQEAIAQDGRTFRATLTYRLGR